MTAKKKESTDKAKKQVERLEKELKEEQERSKRLAADYANLERRVRDQHQELRSQASQHLLEQLFPIFDNFYRASQHAPSVTIEDLPDLTEDDFRRIFNYFAGLRMIEKQMEEVLAEAGLRRIPTRGETFDPKRHEAISYEENSEVPADHVIDEIEAGWTLGDRVIKPAKVRVSRG